MGERPKGMTLDASIHHKTIALKTAAGQRLLRKRKQKEHSQGHLQAVTHLLVDLCLSKGINYQTVYSRIKKGWSVDEAISSSDSREAVIPRIRSTASP